MRIGRWAALLLSLVALGAVMFGLYRFTELERFLTTAGPGGAPVRLAVKTDSDTVRLVEALAQPKLVRAPGLMRRYLRSLHPPKAVPRGIYLLPPEAPPLDLIARLERGDIEQRSLAIVPGQTLEEVAQTFVTAGLVESPQAILRVARSRRWLRRQGIRAPSADGYLAPGIYQLPLGRSPAALLAPAAKRAQEAYRALPKNAHPRAQLLRIASILELSKLPKREWRSYAAVLWGRLGRGEALDSRLVRARAKAEGWTLPASGLPPIPLCVLSPQALAAAAEPDHTTARWLVRRDNGSHVFCEDRGCYRREMERYQPKQPRDGSLP